MRVLIDNAVAGTNGTWTATVEPNQLLRLARPTRQGGKLSVVMISNPTFEVEQRTLHFELESALLLNLGNSNDAIFLDSRESKDAQLTSASEIVPRKMADGDRRFLDELKTLPIPLQEVGKKLLAEVRAEFPGALSFKPISKKFVETPDNFWVVRIQHRVKSFRVVIYGNPEDHVAYASLRLVPDMGGYSSFLLDRDEQLADAISVVRAAQYLKSSRR